MSVAMSESRVKSYRAIMQGTCPAEEMVVSQTVEIRNEIAEIKAEIERRLSDAKEMAILNSFPLKPNPEDGQIDESLNEKREELTVALGPVEKAMRDTLQVAENLEEEFDDKSRHSLTQRRNQNNDLHAKVDEVMDRMPAVKNLSAETVKEIKDIVLKSPEEIQAALEKLDPTNTAGLKDIVNALTTDIQTFKQELAERKVKVSESDMTLFAKTRQQMQALLNQTGNTRNTLQDLAKNLELVTRGADPNANKKAIQLAADLNKPRTKVVQSRIGRAAPAA